MRRVPIVCLLLVAHGCGLVLDLEPGDPDAARADASRTDGAIAADAAVVDASSVDTSAIADADRTRDGDAPVDSGAACPAGGCGVFECTGYVGARDMAGIVLSEAFWPGFVFEVPPGSEVETTRVGLTASNSTTSAFTVFGAIVALSASNDRPDDPALMSADVLGTTTMNVPARAETTTAGPLVVRLPPGWYAAVYGGGAFGGTIGYAGVWSQNETGRCDNGIAPFAIRQSDGAIISQSSSPHMFVDLAL